MRFFVSSLLVTAMSVFSASAVLAGEDIPLEPVYTERLEPLPFAGAYIGATVGWVHANSDPTGIPGGNFPNESYSSSDDGWALGGHIGYSWQRGHVVYGVEADLSWLDVDPTTRNDLVPPQTFKTSYNYFGTARVRLGWAIDNHLLVYGTGGFAYASVKHQFRDPFLNINRSVRDIKTGWTVGGGIERALGHWTLRAEALYVDLHDTTLDLTTCCAAGRVRWEDDFVVARVGFSIPLHHKKQDYEPLK